MAERLRYIDFNLATGANDGSSWSDAYQTFALAESSERADLVSAGDTLRYLVKGVEPNRTVDITFAAANWTVDSTHNITIEAYDRHDGTHGSGTVLTPATYNYGLIIETPYTIVDGLTFDAADNHRDALRFTATAINSVAKNNLIYGLDGTSTRGLYALTNCDGIKFINNIVVDCAGRGIYVSWCNDSYVYNNVSINNGTNMEVGGNTDYHCYLKNNYFGAAITTNIYLDANSYTITTCYSDTGDYGTTVAACSTSSGAYFTNVTAGSEDVHIGASSELRGVGTDLSGDGIFPFNYDFEGDTRTSWDVGADEYIAASVGDPAYYYLQQ